MAESVINKLIQARKIAALKGHLTRVFNKTRIALAEDEVDKNLILELQETLCDKRDIFVNEIYNVRMLGISWDAKRDALFFTINLAEL